jgi:predicted Zn-dependent protease
MHAMGSANNKDRNTLMQAEQLYNECLNRNPNHRDCHRALAVLLVETDRSDRAFVLLKNWAVRSPQSADARIELARLYYEFGDAKTAETQLHQALQLDQTRDDAFKALAHIDEVNGDYQQALANYQRAYTLGGYSPALASRIAALNNTVSGGSSAPGTAGGTRTVSADAANSRY